MENTSQQFKTEAELRLAVKKAILKSWASELLKQGVFDHRKYTDIVKKIDSLKNNPLSPYFTDIETAVIIPLHTTPTGAHN